jgi:hypothetical protein
VDAVQYKNITLRVQTRHPHLGFGKRGFFMLNFMDAKEKLEFFNEIRDEFYLVSKRGYSNAFFHLDERQVGKILVEYCAAHSSDEFYENKESNEEEEDKKACDCIFFNLQSDFYRLLVALEKNARK